MPEITIHNMETGEIITREMNEEELFINNLVLQEQKSNDELLEKNSKARAALLERLGITEEEAQLLLS